MRSMTLVLALLSAAMAAPGCAHKPIIRDATTFTIETLAEIARQEEAADALIEAATDAASRGDFDACVRYAKPALLIQAKARAQGIRSLWLAGLQYPVQGFQLPADPKERQPDPGPAPAPEPVTTICNPPPAED